MKSLKYSVLWGRVQEIAFKLSQINLPETFRRPRKKPQISTSLERFSLKRRRRFPKDLCLWTRGWTESCLFSLTQFKQNALINTKWGRFESPNGRKVDSTASHAEQEEENVTEERANIFPSRICSPTSFNIESSFILLQLNTECMTFMASGKTEICVAWPVEEKFP